MFISAGGFPTGVSYPAKTRHPRHVIRDRRFRNVIPNNWMLGSVVITDPGDQPLSPDQSSFPVCWPLGSAGDPGPPTRSACHPIGKNGNDSSRVRQFSVVWVNTPHEKHPSAETVDASNSVTAERSCTTGFDVTTVPNNRCMRRSRSDGMGLSRGFGVTGVGNRFLIIFSRVSVSGDAVGICSSTATWQTVCIGRLPIFVLGSVSTSR